LDKQNFSCLSKAKTTIFHHREKEASATPDNAQREKKLGHNR
jgi:hypothetical protein